jgi:cytidylate kinase
MMATITISRQLGSLGDEVARAIAMRLNFRVVCRELINQAAIQCGSPEIALSVIDDLGLLGFRPSTKNRQAFFSVLNTVMEQYANEGNYVIVGRAGQMILRDRPDVFHVRVVAPIDVRATRLVAQQQISFETSLTQITASDQTRRNYLRRYYQAKWDDPELYDLIVNTGRLAPEQAACLICEAMSHCLKISFS